MVTKRWDSEMNGQEKPSVIEDGHVSEYTEVSGESFDVSLRGCAGVTNMDDSTQRSATSVESMPANDASGTSDRLEAVLPRMRRGRFVGAVRETARSRSSNCSRTPAAGLELAMPIGTLGLQALDPRSQTMTFAVALLHACLQRLGALVGDGHLFTGEAEALLQGR